MVTTDLRQRKEQELKEAAACLGRPLTQREIKFMDWMQEFCDLETVEIFSRMIFDAVMGVKK